MKQLFIIVAKQRYTADTINKVTISYKNWVFNYQTVCIMTIINSHAYLHFDWLLVSVGVDHILPTVLGISGHSGIDKLFLKQQSEHLATVNLS